MCAGCLARWQALALHPLLAGIAQPYHTRYQFPYRLREPMERPAEASESTVNQEFESQGVVQPPAPPAVPPPRFVYLVRHGETTYNVEGRLPGQLEGVALTEKGRQQAYRAAVALSGIPLSAVVSSPLERALETAQALARGGGLDVRTDARLMDTDVGTWAGQKIVELENNDPSWKEFLAQPNEPPPGVESLAQVQERAMAAMHDILADASLGNYVALVAHADIVKLILATYIGMHVATVRYVSVANASISALAFEAEQPARILAINWTPLPAWLAPPPRPVAGGAAAQTQTGAIVGLQPPFDPSEQPGQASSDQSATGESPSVVSSER